jgi:hypothetical protein
VAISRLACEKAMPFFTGRNYARSHGMEATWLSFSASSTPLFGFFIIKKIA